MKSFGKVVQHWLAGPTYAEISQNSAILQSVQAQCTLVQHLELQDRRESIPAKVIDASPAWLDVATDLKASPIPGTITSTGTLSRMTWHRIGIIEGLKRPMAKIRRHGH